MAYIDAEKLLLDVQRYLMPNVEDDGTVTVENAERYFLKLIKQQPTANAVEVVRCKDCKHWKLVVVDPIFKHELGNCKCSNWENNEFWCQTWEDDFCSFGERKAEE